MYIDEEGDFCSFSVADLMEICKVCGNTMGSHNVFCDEEEDNEHVYKGEEDD